MDKLIQNFKADMAGIVDKAPLLIYAVLILLLFIIFGKITASLLKKGLDRGEFSKTWQTFFLKLIRWTFYLLGMLMALNTLGFPGVAASILAGGGITAVVLGFAFRDIGENILAGFFLAFSRPFRIGDLIRSEGLEGRVKGMELRHTHIRTADGCDIFIPSSQIFSKPLFNYTRDGLRRAEFTIGVDYGDDIQQALALLIQTISGLQDILKDPSPSVGIAGFSPAYVELQVYFWINAFEQKEALARIRTRAMEACRKALLEHHYTLSNNVTTAIEMSELFVKLTNGLDRH